MPLSRPHRVDALRRRRHIPAPSVVRLWAAGLLLACTSAAGTAPADLTIERLPGIQAKPTGVRLEFVGEAVRLIGEVRRSAVSPRRRLVGRVHVHLLDEKGAVLAEWSTRVTRATPARHTHRAHFTLDLGRLPAQGQTLRISFGRPPTLADALAAALD